MENTDKANNDKTIVNLPINEIVNISREIDIRKRDVEKDFFYFAGGLFNHQELVGNLLLGSAIHNESNGTLVPDLPQNKESSVNPNERHPHTIRAKDLLGVLVSDYCVFMFEGMALDEGMLIELAFAKNLGIPSVIVRTDFRKGGDQEGNDKENWNLMCSDWPLSKIVTCNSMDSFASSIANPEKTSVSNIIQSMYSPIAKNIIKEFKELKLEAPVVCGSKSFLRQYFKQIIASYDGSETLLNLVSDEFLNDIISRKIEKRLLKCEE